MKRVALVGVLVAGLAGAAGLHGRTPAGRIAAHQKQNVETSLALIRRQEALATEAQARLQENPTDWRAAYVLASRMFYLSRYQTQIQKTLGLDAAQLSSLTASTDEVRALALKASRLARTEQERSHTESLLNGIRLAEEA